MKKVVPTVRQQIPNSNSAKSQKSRFEKTNATVYRYAPIAGYAVGEIVSRLPKVRFFVSSSAMKKVSFRKRKIHPVSNRSKKILIKKKKLMKLNLKVSSSATAPISSIIEYESTTRIPSNDYSTSLNDDQSKSSSSKMLIGLILFLGIVCGLFFFFKKFFGKKSSTNEEQENEDDLSTEKDNGHSSTLMTYDE